MISEFELKIGVGSGKLQLRAEGGFRVIMGLGCGIRKEPEQRGIHDFSSDVISSTDQRENHKLNRNEPTVRINCVTASFNASNK